MKYRMMKLGTALVSVVLAVIAVSCASTGNTSGQKISTQPQASSMQSPAQSAMDSQSEARQGPYLGQIVPGSEPERFGTGFINGQFHSAPTFSPDGNEVWWAGAFGSAKIFSTRIQDGIWTIPTVFNFPGGISSVRDPFISPDGNRLYFISSAAIPDSSPAGKENLWMSERKGKEWADPIPLPAEVNALALHWTVSVAENYNLYFSATTVPGNNDIYLSRWSNGRYQAPERLPLPLSSEINEYTPNIAPDESYILFARFKGNSDIPRLHISYATMGGWSEPRLIENVPYCISPVITPDRQYVIYLSSASSLSWRDTAFIEELRNH